MTTQEMQDEIRRNRGAVRVLRTLAKGENDIATLAIRSAHFGTFLGLDGRGSDSGISGKVFSHSYVSLWEMFRIVPQSDGTHAIQSLQFDSWLRMEANDVGNDPGGIVTCYPQITSQEKFVILPQEDGSVAIQSVAFGTFLRMDSIGVALQPTGGGIVNCSRELRSWERFFFDVLPPVFGIKSIGSNLYLRMECHTEPRVSGQTYFGPWQKFELIWQDDGTVSIKSIAFRKYLSVLDNNRVGCSSTAGQRERFSIILQEDRSVSILYTEQQTVYLSISNNGEVALKPTQDNFTKFEIIVDC